MSNVESLIQTEDKNIATRDKIEQLQEMMLEMPQAPGMDTEHFFAGGMYCRKITIPFGNIIISKVHKTEHLFIGCSGQLVVYGQGETYVLEPGMVIPSDIGTKRLVVAMTDVVCMTVHKTDVTDVNKLEAALMEECENALYDVDNQPKPGVVIGEIIRGAIE